MTHPFANLGYQIIASLGEVSAISVTRRTAGNHVDGVWVPGTPTVYSVDAVVQPVKPKSLQQPVEGERTQEEIAIWTVEPLVSSDVNNRLEADLISWAGRAWKVISVEDWNVQAKYGKAIARRVDA